MGPKRSKGPLRDRLPVKLFKVKTVPDKTDIVSTSAGMGDGVSLKLTDTDSSTVADAVAVAVAALPSQLRARLTIARTQALLR